MKAKILAGVISLALGFCASACCDDDDYSPATGTLVQSVTTGSSDATSTSVTLHGTVSGLQTQAASAYVVGFYYGSSADALTETVVGALDGTTVDATIDGLLNNTTIYYQAFATLQKTVTYKGDVKSVVTTDATVTTASAKSLSAIGATLGGAIAGYPDDATCGIVIAASSDVEKVRAGLRIENASLAGSFEIAKAGLAAGSTYYYAAYLDLGAGVVYGDVESFTTNEMTLNPDDDFVDLGLSTKWCKFNVGATNEAELGGLFAFGDLTGVNSSTSASDYAPNKDTYKTEYDVVFKTLGQKATLPTADEFQELFTKCDVEWLTEEGRVGYKFTSHVNGNSIFLPAAGSRTGNVVSGEGEKGLYATGSINKGNADFAVSYEFANGGNAQVATPRFQALSVRPVSTAKNVVFDKSLLYTTWYIDLNDLGESFKFDGPLYYYGTDDSWATVTNNEPYDGGDHWNWSPVWKDNTWLGAAADYGYMTLNEDGTMTVHRRVVDEAGAVAYVDEDGTFTVDEANRTITLSVDILGFGTFNGLTLDAKTSLKVLSLTEETTQIAIVRDPVLANDGACLLVYNYISKKVKEENEKISISLMTVGGDYSGNWGTVVNSYAPATLEANGVTSGSIVYNGAMTSGGVFLVDFVGFAKRFPQGMVRIDDIRADGRSVKFDANKFLYGDIENKGNWRVELFNMWGATKNAGCSPFSNNAAELSSEPAISFADSVAIDYTIVTEAFAKTYAVNLATQDSKWHGPRDYNDGQTISVGFDAEAHKFVFEPQTVSFNYQYTADPENDEKPNHALGSIMTFLEVADIYAYFPQMHATLDALSLDGVAQTFDASKVIDANETSKYRLELWNMYGATSSAGCAFGIPADGVISELSFSSSMALTATFHSLFPVPTFD